MTKGNPAASFHKAYIPLIAVLAIAIGLTSTAVLSAINRQDAPALARLDSPATTLPPPVLRTEHAPSFRVAKTYKYERPKTTQRAAPQPKPKVQVKTPRAPAATAPARRSAPTTRRRRTIKRQRSRRAPRKSRSRRARGGSCSGCRNSCYVRYRVRSNSRQFTPCMRRCWYQLCR